MDGLVEWEVKYFNSIQINGKKYDETLYTLDFLIFTFTLLLKLLAKEAGYC